MLKKDNDFLKNVLTINNIINIMLPENNERRKKNGYKIKGT